MILGNSDIHRYINNKLLIITPFKEEIIRENGIDLRLGKQIARLKQTESIFDTHKKIENPEQFYECEEVDSFIIKPFERLLVCTLEIIELNRDLMGFVNLRSSYARVGLTLPPTIIDAGFRGQLTIEIIGGAFPVRLYTGDRFVHIILAKLTSESVSYNGSYLNQKGVAFPNFQPQKFM